MNIGAGQVRRVAGAGVARPAAAGGSGAPHVVPIRSARWRGCVRRDRPQAQLRPASGLRRVQNIEAKPRFALVVDR